MNSAGEGLGCTFTVELPVYFHSSTPSASRSRIYHRRSFLAQGTSRGRPLLVGATEGTTALSRSLRIHSYRHSENISNHNSNIRRVGTGSHCSEIPNAENIPTFGDFKPGTIIPDPLSFSQLPESSPKLIDASSSSSERNRQLSLLFYQRCHTAEEKSVHLESLVKNETIAVGETSKDEGSRQEIRLNDAFKDVGNGNGTGLYDQTRICEVASTQYSSRPEKLISVLVVDDAALNRKMLCRLLKGRCNRTAEACDGADAVVKVLESMQAGHPYDVILMDYQMPNLDGPGAARELRSNGYVGLIIGITGMTVPEDMDFFRSAGADCVLPKPVNVEDLDPIFQGEICLLRLQFHS